MLPALAVMPVFADEAVDVSDWATLKSVVAPVDGNGVGGSVTLVDNIAGPVDDLIRAYTSADVSIDFNGYYIGGADSDNVVNIGGDDQAFWISLGTATFDNAQFQNISGVQSGLVRNYAGSTVFNGSTVFENISVGTGGAAFSNTSSGTNTFNGAVSFLNNDAALVSNAGSINFNDNVIFMGNTNTSNGGAIQNTDTGAITFAFVDGEFATMFQENSSSGDGGAVYNNGGTITFNNVTSFVDNSASVYGGALNNNSGTVTFAENVSFNFNTAGSYGAALYNAGTMTFNGLASFYSNASDTIDAVHNTSSGTLTFNGGISYLNNGDVEDGSFGTFTNQGTIAIFGDAIFRGTVGQAIQNEGMFTISDADLFEISGSTDGILGSTAGNTMSITADEILISNNMTVTSYGGISNMGANAYFYGDVNTFANNVQGITIDKEYYKLGGGALQNRALGNAGVTVIGLESGLSTNVFSNNTSNKNGGAIHARAEAETDVGSVTLNGVTSFIGNQAGEQGGAISNMPLLGQSTFTFNGDTSFRNNIAGGNGGAIYNAGDMIFNGKVSFSGNMSGATFTFDEDTGAITGYSGGVANDIYNDGTITFNGDVELNGGITGNGALILSNGKYLNIGNASITQNSIDMNGGRIIATIGNVDDDYRINVGTFTGDGTIALTLADEGTYALFGGSTFENTVFEGDITFDSPIYNLVWTDSNHSVTATRRTAEEIASYNGVSDGAASTVLNLMDSSANALNDLGMAVQEQLALGNVTAVENATKAIHPETESVTQAVSTSVQNAIANLAAGRMALMRQSIGRSGGDMPARSGVWVEGMYNKSKQNDAFDGYTRGVVAGIDTQFSRSFMVGIGYSYAHSDVSSSVRDTEIDSNTVFVYGQYKPTAWYMNAMVNYTMSDYEEKSNVLGTLVKADYDVDAFGAQVMTGYDFAGGITPEIGLRYMHISADEYKNSLGIKNKFEDADYLTAVLGTKYAFDYRVARGFTLSPELRYAVKYDVVSDEQVATVIMPGINSYVLDGARLSRVGAELGAGLVMKYQDFSLALNYDIELREGYTSQTGRVRARFVF